MRRNLKTAIAASALVGGLLAAPPLYAHAPGGSQGGMMQGGEGGMMEQMSQMMATCNEMTEAHMEHHDPRGQGMTPQKEQAPSLQEERPSAPEQRG